MGDGVASALIVVEKGSGRRAVIWGVISILLPCCCGVELVVAAGRIRLVVWVVAGAPVVLRSGRHGGGLRLTA
jgi:hypothetical protein